MMTDPSYLLEAKQVVNEKQAKKLPPIDISVLSEDPFLAKIVPQRVIKELYEVGLKPWVAGISEMITSDTQAPEQIVVLQKGKARHSDGHFIAEGSVIGVLEVATQLPRWRHSIRAQSRCDCWVIGAKTFAVIMEQQGCRHILTKLSEKYTTF
eukprot:gene16641-5105_t